MLELQEDWPHQARLPGTYAGIRSTILAGRKRSLLLGLNSYLAAFVALSKERKELGKLHNWLYSKKPELLFAEATVAGGKSMSALLDPGSQLNLISAIAAKDCNLKIKPLENVMADAANGSEITIYGMTMTEVSLKDLRRRS